MISEHIKLYKNEYNYLSSKDFDKIGFQNFREIKDIEITIKYVSKYCLKNPIFLNNHRIYNCSKGLRTSIKEDIKEFENEKQIVGYFKLNNINVSKTFQNNYISKYSLKK